MKAKAKNDLAKIFSYVLLFVWVLICTVPVIYLFVASFQHSAIFTSPAKILSLRGFTLENYIKALKIGNFIFFLKNSIIVSICAVIISLAVCLPLAYGLAKMALRQKQNLSFLILSMRFVPYMVLAIPLFFLFLKMGLTGSRPGLLLAHLAMQIPVITWLLVGFFESIPYEIEEAAIIDGCSSFRVFWNIGIPIALPGINACAILAFIVSWNEYLFALFLAGYEAQPLTVGITRFLGSVETGAQYGAIDAYGCLIVAPVILFNLFANRYIVSGLTAGALKG